MVVQVPNKFENPPDILKLEDELRNEVVSSSGDGLAIASLYSLMGFQIEMQFHMKIIP